jgi:hypothetical protein
MDANADADAARRGPGRPPSKPPAPPLEMRGVVDSPRDADNRLEFVYGDPTMFKDLFTFLRNMKARDVHIRCDPAGITFFARDHTKTSRIVAAVAGRHVNWHYCEGTYWLGLNRDNVEKMFAAIDRSFYKVTIFQTHDDPNTLTFVFKDAEIEVERNYKMTLSAYAADDDLYDAERQAAAVVAPAPGGAPCPLEFTLTAKHFKKSVCDAGAYSDVVTYEKLGRHPLQLTYARASVVYNEVYRSDAKIALRTTVGDGGAFRVTLKVANVKSFAASMVTDDVRVYCREDADVVFRSAIDAKALVVSVLTRLA